MTRGVVAVLCHGSLALRLPEMLGVWALCLCLYRFVARRLSSLAGVAAMLFPLVTIAGFYGTEARPYGLILGLAGLAPS